MSSSTATVSTPLITLEDATDEREGRLVKTVTLRPQTDAPLLVRVADDYTAFPGIATIVVDRDDAPDRWTVEGAELVFETLVTSDGASVVYALDAESPEAVPEGHTPSIQAVQPLDPADARADELPTLRDARTFEHSAAGAGVTTDGEASDEDVRRAVKTAIDRDGSD